MEIRAITKAEQLYTYSQSSQISSQCGLIGYLRADMGSDGNGFYTTWFGYCDDLKTGEFKTRLEGVINECRLNSKYGGILASRTDMLRYCREHDDGAFVGNYTTEYGYRIDTDEYSYLMRLNPIKGDYNLYCYCYRKEWLNDHLHQAEKGIRFITPDYKEQFRIEDGDQIRIPSANGEYRDSTVRYIDEYHIELDGRNLYHICQFAEMMEAAGNGYPIPLRKSLPEYCYSVLPGSGDLIIINKGESGYYKCDFSEPGDNRALADELNAEGGVSKAQEAAMLAGSMFGWSVPAADPRNYDDNGEPIRVRTKDRGDER